MQNRYTGDIGDFGKLGLLRTLSAAGLSIGINWYLTTDESHNGDGRHVNYLFDERFRACDEPLWEALGKIVKSGQREVGALERANLVNAKYYAAQMGTKPLWTREAWHKAGLDALRDVDVVFADPDTGLIVPSAKGTSRSIKYVEVSELADYYRQGSSVIYYQHKARRPDEFYAEQHRQLLSSEAFSDATGLGLKFRTTSQRFFFFILQPRHREAVPRQVDRMVASAWGEHFSLV